VIGRLTAYGLAAAGEYGVRRTIELLTQELHILMTLAGIPDIASFTGGTVAPRLTGRRDGYPCGRQRRGRDAERRGRAALVGARELGRHRSRRRHRRRSFSVVRGGLSLRGQVFLVREVSLLPVRKDCVRLLALPSLARELVDLLLCVLRAALRDCLGERGLVVGWQLACLKRRVSEKAGHADAREALVRAAEDGDGPRLAVDADVVLALAVLPESVETATEKEQEEHSSCGDQWEPGTPPA